MERPTEADYFKIILEKCNETNQQNLTNNPSLDLQNYKGKSLSHLKACDRCQTKTHEI